MGKPADQRISLLTYIAFLFGSRRAIEAILSAHGVLPIAVLLTVSAGLAREYDGEQRPNRPREQRSHEPDIRRLVNKLLHVAHSHPAMIQVRNCKYA